MQTVANVIVALVNFYSLLIVVYVLIDRKSVV